MLKFEAVGFGPISINPNAVDALEQGSMKDDKPTCNLILRGGKKYHIWGEYKLVHGKIRGGVH